MRIEIKASEGKVIVAAVNDDCGLVALGTGTRVDEAARDLISKFAAYQAEAIKALDTAGIVRVAREAELS